MYANAVLCTLLFLIHPTHVEAVAWIAGRTALLGATAYLWAMYCFARFWPEPAIGISAAGVALFAAGLFMKENVITVPATFGVYVLLAGGICDRWRRLVPVGLALAGVGALWVVLRQLACGSATKITNTTEALETLWSRLPFYAARSCQATRLRSRLLAS